MLARNSSVEGRTLASRSASFVVEAHHSHHRDVKDNINATGGGTGNGLSLGLIFIVAVSLFCDYLLHTLCIPILPNVFENEVSTLLIGVVFAAKSFWQFFANPVMGGLVVEKGSKPIIIIGTLVLSLSTLMFAYGVSLQHSVSVSYGIVLVARSIQGISSAAIMSAGMTLCAIAHTESSRGTAMGLAMTGVAAGMLLGLPLGGILSFYLNYWMPFVIVAGILLLTLAFQLVYFYHPSSVQIPDDCAYQPNSISDSLLLLNEELNRGSSLYSARMASYEPYRASFRESIHEQTVSVIGLLQHPLIAFLGFLCVLANCAIGVLDPLIPLWLNDEFGLNILYQSLVFGVCSLTYLLGTPLAGVLSDKFPKYVCLSVGMLMFGGGMCMFFFCPLHINFAILALAFIGVGCAFVDTPILPLLAELSLMIPIEEEQLGLTYALNDMLLCFGFTIGPLIGPILQSCLGGGTAGFQRTCFVIGIILLLSIPFSICVLRPTKHDRTKTEKYTPIFSLHDEGSFVIAA